MDSFSSTFLLIAGVISTLLVANTRAQDVTSLTLVPTLTTIGVHWTVDDPNNQINNFHITWDDDSATVDFETYDYIIEDLLPCDEQRIEVIPRAASNVPVGTSKSSTTSTLSKAPPEVGALQATTISAREILLSWDRPVTPCEITDYFVMYEGRCLWDANLTDVGMALVPGDDNNGTVSTTMEYLLEPLMPYSEYNISVIAANDAGNSSIASLVEETKQAPPSAPQNLNANATGDATVTVSWTEPLQLNGILGNYSVYWLKNESVVGKAIVPETVYTIKEVDIAGADSVQVRATTAAGEGVAAEAQIIPLTCSLPFAFLRRRCIMVDTLSVGTWPEMRNLCGQLGGHLVKVSSGDFMADLVQFIITQGLHHHNYWIGASDDTMSGLWEWLDGTAVRLGTPFWGDDSDQIQYPKNVFDVNYAFLASYDHFFMHDIGANYSATAQAICEQGVTA